MNDSISKPVSSKFTCLPILFSDWLMEITWMVPLVSLHRQESHVVISFSWLAGGNHMNDFISKPVVSKITCLPTLSSDWLMEITWMIPLVSLFHQESHVSSISKPPLMMSSVFCLQHANMIIQTSDNKRCHWWCHWWCRLENFNPYLSSEWLCLWLFGLKLRILDIPMIFLWCGSVFRM
jgi:hypothetical protein